MKKQYAIASKPMTPLCSLALSRLLKDAGFDEDVDHYWSSKGTICYDIRESHLDRTPRNFNTDPKGVVSCPTLSAAQLWIWERFKIWVTLEWTGINNTFAWYLNRKGTPEDDTWQVFLDQGGEEDPSLALEAGLVAAIRKGDEIKFLG